jgi:serine/threonine-protein kinase
MGEVYRARHPTLSRSVAIKILPEHAGGEEARKRFIREAQTIARLQHPNIITLYDSGEQDGKPYMVMEYIDGQDLSELLEERDRLPLDEALSYLQDIAVALDHAHTQGVVHRDIKPSNVMIEPVTSMDGEQAHRAVLMDFGIAKVYAAMTQLTGTGMVGTLDYIAPEQIQGARDVDPLADIYSFGVMIYQVLTGQLPFKHNNPGALVMAHLIQPPPDPRETVPDIPPGAAYAIVRAMAKKPQERFGTACDLIDEITSAPGRGSN